MQLSRLFYSCAILIVCTWVQLDAQKDISGAITDADGNPLVGATVVEEGTTNGAITDINGQFSMTVASDESQLNISYVGMNESTITVGANDNLSITLDAAVALDEIVVTALGIRRDERSLGYSVGRVDGGELSRVAQENVLNGIAGKVSGVTINSTGGAGSSVSMVIRGANSLNGDNQPLFVVDGVPIANTLNNVSQVGRDNRVDFGNAIADLNPDDIASVSILKGPSAAALYGSRAGNGVVLITTKTGAANKGLTVSLNSNTVFDNPFKFLDFHTMYATGVRPYTPDNNPYPDGQLLIEEGSAAGIGPKLDQGYTAVQWNSPLDDNGSPIPLPLVSHPDNIRDFVQTGINTTNNLSIANRNDVVTYRASFTNLTSRGLIPNADFHKNYLNLSSAVNITKNFKLSTNVNVGRTHSNNRPAGNRGSNPIEWAYKVSPHIDINDLRDYWVEGREGIEQRSQAPGDYNNPFFLANEAINSFNRDRLYGNLMAEWQITPKLSLMGRYSLDRFDEERETRIAASYTREANGTYGLINLDRSEKNADFLATYTTDISDFGVSISGGGNILRQEGSNIRNATRQRGSGLIIPGLYTLSNISPNNLDFSNFRFEKAIYSVYGLMNLSFQDMLYLDLTARNDWSSTLPAENRSYFYPSAALSVLLNNIIDMPNFNMVKLRAGWAQVGNDTDPYSLFPTLSNQGAWDGVTRLGRPSGLLTPDLKPEISTSFEVGTDIEMFDNRLRFEATIYKVENENQILGLNLPVSSGFTNKTINAGLVSSRGWEVMLGFTPIRNQDFSWDVNFNLYRNRTKIEELAEGIDRFQLWRDAKGGAWTYVGEEIGDIYDAELITVTDPNSPYFGYPILDDEGSWQDIDDQETRNKIGNFNPDFILGSQSILSYKNFTLSFTLDWRKGGQFVSQTYRYSESDLKTQRWLDNLIVFDGPRDQLPQWLKDNADEYITDGINVVGGPGDEFGGQPFDFGVVVNDGTFNPGVIAQYDDDGNITGYIENLGGPDTRYIPYAANYPWSFTSASTFDADFIKLREIAFGYQLPRSLTNSIGVQNASISLYSRNVILWTKAKIGIDPENAFQPEGGTQGNGITFKQGIERYNVNPWVLPVGIKLGVTF